MNNETGFYGFREKGATKYQSFALELVPGFKCQLRCLNCFKRNERNGVSARGGDMPPDFVKDALSQAKGCGFAEAVFIGGEPTLHPDLPEFMAFASGIGLTPILCTNGIKLADANYAARVAVPGSVLVLHAPLPNGVQDKHVDYNGYRALLEKAYDNVIALKQVTIVAEVVVIRAFKDHILELYRWCLGRGITPFIEINRRYDDGRVYAETEEPEGVKILFDQLADMAPAPPSALVPPAFGQPCTMSITGLHVKNFGDGNYAGVYSCCAQKVKHGDLLRHSLAEVLRDKSLAVFKNQDEWIYGPCRSCRYYGFCRGGCRGEASLAFGCPRASCPVCWHIPVAIRNDPSVMTPLTCAGCPLEGNPACHPRR